MRWHAELLAGVVLALSLAVPGTANAGMGPGPGGPPPPPSGPPASSGSSSATVANCRLYANSASFGYACLGPGGSGKTIEQLLGADEFPTCRVDPWPDGQLPPDPPPGPDGQPKPGAWWYQTCLVPKDPQHPEQGPFDTAISAVWVDAGDPPPNPLTLNQQLVWQIEQDAYPEPVLAVGPVNPPRVNVPTGFWLGEVPSSPGLSSGGPIVKTVPTISGPVQLEARVVRTVIWPDAMRQDTSDPSKAPVQCIAPTRPVTHPVSAGEPCSFTYRRSSATRHDDPKYPQRYAAEVSTFWQVSYTDGQGVRHVLNAEPFEQHSVLWTPVAEIQTLNR